MAPFPSPFRHKPILSDESLLKQAQSTPNASLADITLPLVRKPKADELVSWIDSLESRVKDTLRTQSSELEQFRVEHEQERTKERFRFAVFEDLFRKLGEIVHGQTEEDGQQEEDVEEEAQEIEVDEESEGAGEEEMEADESEDQDMDDTGASDDQDVISDRSPAHYHIHDTKHSEADDSDVIEIISSGAEEESDEHKGHASLEQSTRPGLNDGRFMTKGRLHEAYDDYYNHDEDEEDEGEEDDEQEEDEQEEDEQEEEEEDDEDDGDSIENTDSEVEEDLSHEAETSDRQEYPTNKVHVADDAYNRDDHQRYIPTGASYKTGVEPMSHELNSADPEDEDSSEGYSQEQVDDIDGEEPENPSEESQHYEGHANERQDPDTIEESMFVEPVEHFDQSFLESIASFITNEQGGIGSNQNYTDQDNQDRNFDPVEIDRKFDPIQEQFAETPQDDPAVLPNVDEAVESESEYGGNSPPPLIFRTLLEHEPEEVLEQLKETEKRFNIKLNAVSVLEEELSQVRGDSSKSVTPDATALTENVLEDVENADDEHKNGHWDEAIEEQINSTAPLKVNTLKAIEKPRLDEVEQGPEETYMDMTSVVEGEEYGDGNEREIDEETKEPQLEAESGNESKEAADVLVVESMETMLIPLVETADEESKDESVQSIIEQAEQILEDREMEGMEAGETTEMVSETDDVKQVEHIGVEPHVDFTQEHVEIETIPISTTVESVVDAPVDLLYSDLADKTAAVDETEAPTNDEMEMESDKTEAEPKNEDEEPFVVIGENAVLERVDDEVEEDDAKDEEGENREQDMSMEQEDLDGSTHKNSLEASEVIDFAIDEGNADEPLVDSTPLPVVNSITPPVLEPLPDSELEETFVEHLVDGTVSNENGLRYVELMETIQEVDSPLVPSIVLEFEENEQQSDKDDQDPKELQTYFAEHFTNADDDYETEVVHATTIIETGEQEIAYSEAYTESIVQGVITNENGLRYVEVSQTVVEVGDNLVPSEVVEPDEKMSGGEEGDPDGGENPSVLADAEEYFLSGDEDVTEVIYPSTVVEFGEEEVSYNVALDEESVRDEPDENAALEKEDNGAETLADAQSSNPVQSKNSIPADATVTLRKRPLEADQTEPQPLAFKRVKTFFSNLFQKEFVPHRIAPPHLDSVRDQLARTEEIEVVDEDEDTEEAVKSEDVLRSDEPKEPTDLGELDSLPASLSPSSPQTDVINDSEAETETSAQPSDDEKSAKSRQQTLDPAKKIRRIKNKHPRMLLGLNISEDMLNPVHSLRNGHVYGAEPELSGPSEPEKLDPPKRGRILLRSRLSDVRIESDTDYPAFRTRSKSPLKNSLREIISREEDIIAPRRRSRRVAQKKEREQKEQEER